jgi:hypothetical protein
MPTALRFAARWRAVGAITEPEGFGRAEDEPIIVCISASRITPHHIIGSNVTTYGRRDTREVPAKEDAGRRVTKTTFTPTGPTDPTDGFFIIALAELHLAQQLFSRSVPPGGRSISVLCVLPKHERRVRLPPPAPNQPPPIHK